MIITTTLLLRRFCILLTLKKSLYNLFCMSDILQTITHSCFSPSNVFKKAASLRNTNSFNSCLKTKLLFLACCKSLGNESLFKNQNSDAGAM